MKFKDILEKENTLNIQVFSKSDYIKGLKKLGVDAVETKGSKYNDEITVNLKDKDKVIQFMINQGRNIKDIKMGYPELFK